MTDNLPNITRDKLTLIEAQKISAGMPVRTQGTGGDARAMLQRFHANFPFVPIEPFPDDAIGVLFDATAPVDVDLPDGTLWVTLIASGVVFLGVPAIAPPLVNQTQIKGGFQVPIDHPLRMFMFGKRQLSVRGANLATLTVLCYSTVDTGLGDTPNLG